MEALYIEERKHQDRLVAERESRFMVKEDRRSQFVEQYWKECNLYGESASLASKRAVNLQKNRDNDEAKRREVTRSEEHTSELQSLMRISYAVFCLKKKNHTTNSPLYSQRQMLGLYISRVHSSNLYI